MAVPSTRKESKGYVYCWTDLRHNMFYVGVKKGSFDQNYITSSKFFNEEYQKRPNDFQRSIISKGTWEDSLVFEEKILRSVNAATNKSWYNRSNGSKSFVCNGHTEETREKMSKTWRKKNFYNCDHEKAIAAWKGSKHTETSKQKMSDSRKKHRETFSKRMIENNPMKNPKSVAKMLETRRRNKERKNGNTNG